jgi:hypothetical protein
MKKIVKLISFVFIYCFFDFKLYTQVKTIHLQPVISVKDLLEVRKDIVYTKVKNFVEYSSQRNILFDDEQKMWWEKDVGIHPELFILSIPFGSFCFKDALVIVDGMYVDEFVWEPTKNEFYFPLVDISKLPTPEKIKGKLAVVGQSGQKCYYHWMVEVLPKLALLQESGISYDYLYIPTYIQFMKETIKLLGIDPKKIISKKYDYVQFDELIVPSMPSDYGYCSEYVINFLRNTFIPLAEKAVNHNLFAKRVFVSRKKASSRKIINEDEVFELFKKHGFVRYNLEDLSVLEQVALFYNAEMIVAEHGAGLTNIIFAQPKTKVIEIFQARIRAMYWYLCQQLGLDYSCVKTIEFDIDKKGNFHSTVPLDEVKKILDVLFN